MEEQPPGAPGPRGSDIEVGTKPPAAQQAQMAGHHVQHCVQRSHAGYEGWVVPVIMQYPTPTSPIPHANASISVC